LVENAPALVRVIKQNQAFNQRGDSSFTFNLCSLEPCAEDACSLLAPAGPSPEQARYQRIAGNAGFETSYEEQQKKLPNVRLGSITEILLQNLYRRIKYSESLVVCQLLIQLRPPSASLQIEQNWLYFLWFISTSLHRFIRNKDGIIIRVEFISGNTLRVTTREA
jgi:hypothetical protein